MGVISYHPAVRSPLLILKEERLDEKNFRIDNTRYLEMKSSMESKLKASSHISSVIPPAERRFC